MRTVSNELVTIQAWLLSKLRPVTSLTSIVGDRIDSLRALESGDGFPALGLQVVSAQNVLVLNGGDRIYADTFWRVLGVDMNEDAGTSLATLNTIDKLVQGVLASVNDDPNVTTSYGVIFSCTATAPVMMEEVKNGKTIRYLGTEYHIRARGLTDV